MSLVGYFSVNRQGERVDSELRRRLWEDALPAMQAGAPVYRRLEDYDAVLRAHCRLEREGDGARGGQRVS